MRREVRVMTFWRNWEWRSCSSCFGTGWVSVMRHDDDVDGDEVRCTVCNGRGKVKVAKDDDD